MGIFKKSLLVLFLLVVLPAVSHAQVSKIVFTTEPQTVKPSELSSSITIQTQDSTNTSVAVGETSDVFVTSSSVVGEFSSSVTNWQSVAKMTMNSNWANRTFYYKNSTEGTYTITVKVIGRTSLKEWSATQSIIISNSTSSSATTTEATSTSTPTTPTSSAIPNTSVVIISTHYSATPLTNTETDTKFEVGAGRPRMSTVGTPIEFNANTNASYTKNIDFKWSFGDGTTGTGQILTHTYTYPGEYIVVLNATSPDGIAVSRTNISVVPASLSIISAEFSRIEVINSSSREINLYGRALVAGSKIFAFPRDTIIKAGQKISFDANVTGLNFLEQSGVSLVVVGTEVRPQEVMAKIEEQKSEQIASIQNQILILQKQLTDISSKQNSANSTGVAVKSPKTEPIPEEVKSITAIAVNAIPDSTKNKENWFQVLKRFFFRTK